jgi:hypothetical protein
MIRKPVLFLILLAAQSASETTLSPVKPSSKSNRKQANGTAKCRSCFFGQHVIPSWH